MTAEIEGCIAAGGTACRTSNYTNLGCRGEACKTAATERMRVWKANAAERVKAGLIDLNHGSQSTYSNYSCRCDRCIEAHRVYQAQWRAKAGRS